MPYRHAQVGSCEVLLISHFGPATASTLRNTFDEVAPDRAWCSGMAAVWDLRRADLATFTIEEMRRLGDYLGHFECRRGVRAALVYRSPPERQLLKLWHVVGNGYLEQERRWFDSLGTAIAWAASTVPAKRRPATWHKGEVCPFPHARRSRQADEPAGAWADPARLTR